MAQRNATNDPNALAEARATIARQAEELARLREQLADNQLVERLEEAAATARLARAVAGSVPHTRLLEMIVETAARVISARAGSLFLIDAEKQELIFEVALGQKAQQVKALRVPMGHGIAGLVAATGQPMIVSDASNDPRQASDIARTVGYMPQSILCMPLFYNGDVIGVLELLDKEGAPSFTADDMELLGVFANQAAMAIEQSQAQQDTAALIRELFASEELQDNSGGLDQKMSDLARRLDEDLNFRRSVEIANLVREIAQQGQDELAACQSILQAFAIYLRTRSVAAGGSGSE